MFSILLFRLWETEQGAEKEEEEGTNEHYNQKRSQKMMKTKRRGKKRNDEYYGREEKEEKGERKRAPRWELKSEVFAVRRHRRREPQKKTQKAYHTKSRDERLLLLENGCDIIIMYILIITMPLLLSQCYTLMHKSESKRINCCCGHDDYCDE